MKKFYILVILLVFAIYTIVYADSWYKIDNDWYCMDNYDNNKTGLQQINSRIYYFVIDKII